MRKLPCALLSLRALALAPLTPPHTLAHNILIKIQYKKAGGAPLRKLPSGFLDFYIILCVCVPFSRAQRKAQAKKKQKRGMAAYYNGILKEYTTK